ncbi:terminase large subunit [Sphingomonas sp. NCPPB 2930]|uniref:terminase large subunit n=1 Tax=Sphingomonas sp. NCPPB 2930 TaxID=3162788 RepID=UPI0036D99FC9
MPSNKTRADRVIAFIEQLPIPDGPAVGQSIKLDPWEESWLRAIYEPCDDTGAGIVRRAVLSVARKNRKSLLVAGLLLSHLIGPESQLNGQIYSCAVDREQAKVIFRMCAQMIQMRPTLAKYLKVVPSTSTIVVTRLDCKGRGSRYRALSAEASSKHGLGADFFVYDEFGEARDNDLYNTLLDSQQLRVAPLAVVISTQNNDPQHPLSVLIDDGLKGEDPTIVCHLHAADEDCALDDREQWIKANPALNHWKPFKPIEVAAKEAMRLPSQEANFRRRYLNQRVSMHTPLIAASDWKSCRAEFDFIPGEPIYLGLDMSMTTDLTALVAVSATNGSRVKAWFWKPADLVAEHAKRDRQPYDVWVRQGHLNASPGRVINPREIARKVIELAAMYDLRGLAFDRARMGEVLRQFDDEQAQAQDGQGDGIRCIAWGQGFIGFAPAINALEAAVLTGDLQHDGHPLLTNNMMNALATMDPAGNRKLDKAASRFRIDGAVSLAMALGLKALDRPTIHEINPFEDPDFRLIA